MKKLCLMLGLAAPLLLAATAPAQTFGVPLVNRAFVRPPGGAIYPPPFTPSAPAPITLPPGVASSFRVQAAAPGMPAAIFFSMGPPVPGLACRPPVPLPIPPCLAPCGWTNQSFDIAPPFASATGVTILRPAGVGGAFVVPVVTPPALVGLEISVQAVVVDPVIGPVFSNAYSVMI